jgi:hypothetical protein
MNLLSRAIAALRPPISEAMDTIRIRTRGESLHRRFLARPCFQIGSAAIMGQYGRDQMEASRDALTILDMEAAFRMLERIDDARRAHMDHVGPASLRPVKVSFSAMDWGRVTHLADKYGDEGLHISLPFVVGGRWISHDVLALLDLASTIVVDMSMQKERPDETIRIKKAADTLGPIMAALYKGDRDCGYHVNMPSPFGPSEIRRHDTTGSPFESFALPKTKIFEDLPRAYQATARIRGDNLKMHVTRFRTFNGDHEIGGKDGSQLSSTLKSLMMFDPRPLPITNPYEPSRRDLKLLNRGRRILLVRYEGMDEFEFPGFVHPEWAGEGVNVEYVRRMDRLLSLLGINKTSNRWEYVADCTYIDDDMHVPIVNHELTRLRFEGEPKPYAEIAEVHWMDVDAPDRPMTFVTEHLLLDQVRAKMGRGELD